MKAGECRRSYTFCCAACSILEHTWSDSDDPRFKHLTEAWAATHMRDNRGWKRIKKRWYCKPCASIRA